MKSIKIPYELQKMNEIFVQNGYQAFLVGGAVRDVILGKNAHDWDVATNATPEDVMRIFNKVIPTGIQHGTVTVHFMKQEFEVTTFRTESDYSDGRHPDKVEYASTIEEDLSRRDFTMNAIAVNISDGTIVDPFGGEEDIKNRLIRSVGSARERFLEDGLRPVRAIRFAGKLNFCIEKDTYSEIFKEEILKNVSRISIERFRDELIKILESDKPSVSLKLLEETGILKMFIPELLKGRNCTQGDARLFHEFDVLDHNFYAADGAPKEKLNVRTAALFHDIAKPDTKKEEVRNGEPWITFYRHDEMGAKQVSKILNRLKFPNSFSSNVSQLIQNHMFHYESTWSDAAVRRFVQRTGIENIEDLFDLRLADIYGMHNRDVRLHDTAVCQNLLELKTRIDEVIKSNAALSIKDLKINGNDLIALGVPKGPVLGKILNELFETVTDDPEMNDREKLLTLAGNLLEHKYS